MSYQGTVRDGQKWCLGPCGRQLPEAAFYRADRRGYVASRCKACGRVAARDRYRRRAKDPAFRRAERTRKRLAYRAACMEV